MTYEARTDDNGIDVRTQRFLEPRRIGGHFAFLAFVLAFLGSAFAAGAHWLSVPHRLCEVHGTIEHGRPEPAAAPTKHAPVPAGPIVRAGDGTHDECSLGICARMESVLPAHVEVPLGFLAEPRGRVIVASDAAPSVPLLRLAPSRSPPA